MKAITINPTLKAIYPHIRLATLAFTATVTPSDDDFWTFLEKEIIPTIQAKIEPLSWSQIEGIKGSREAYKACGIDPSRYRVSSEALFRRIKRKDALYRVNSIVDINNYVSLISGLSVGSYDLDQIQGDIKLRLGKEGEEYQGIGKSTLHMHKMMVLADNLGPFGSSMSDSLRTMVKDSSTNILTIIYCFEDTIDLEALLEKARQAFASYGHVTNIETTIID